MSNWMTKNTGIKAPTRSTSAEGKSGAGGFKNGDRANVTVERIGIKSTDNANLVEKHGEEAAGHYISVMWRVKGTADGKNVNRCVFQNLFVLSKDADRAAKDAQFLATICTLAEQQGTDGIYEDVVEVDEFPDDTILADLIGTHGGIVVGVMENPGRDNSEFVRSLHEQYVFEDVAESGAAQGSGRRRSRNRGE